MTTSMQYFLIPAVLAVSLLAATGGYGDLQRTAGTQGAYRHDAMSYTSDWRLPSVERSWQSDQAKVALQNRYQQKRCLPLDPQGRCAL
jgi:hypothetical protein